MEKHQANTTIGLYAHKMLPFLSEILNSTPAC